MEIEIKTKLVSKENAFALSRHASESVIANRELKKKVNQCVYMCLRQLKTRDAKNQSATVAPVLRYGCTYNIKAFKHFDFERMNVKNSISSDSSERFRRAICLLFSFAPHDALKQMEAQLNAYDRERLYRTIINAIVI